MLEYVKISASVVMAKESNILKSLAFPRFFLCVLNRFDKNNEQKQANKNRKANKQKNSKNNIKNGRWHFVLDEVFTGESTLPNVT